MGSLKLEGGVLGWVVYGFMVAVMVGGAVVERVLGSSCTLVISARAAYGFGGFHPLILH